MLLYAAALDFRAARTDLRDVPFVTIDPPGSMDLDQAMHLTALDGDGDGVDGEPTSCDVYPGLVRSVARLEYVEVQASFDAGNPHPSIAALPELGRARQGSALRREAINLRLPSQTVAPTGDGRWELHLDARPPVMDFNSEISLLAGMVAGQMMAEAGAGVLRTLRPAGGGGARGIPRRRACAGV